MYIYPSILISGREAYHQKMHVDIKEAMDFAKMMKDKDKLEKESWKIGYIYFCPLSQEGSALQVMVPNETDDKELVIKNVLIPFGSAMLLRADIPHSGCYGSVNNARLQAMVLPKSTKGYRNHDLGWISRKTLKEEGFTVTRELKPKIDPNLMMFAAKSIAPSFQPFNYWKLYMESMQGRLTSARAGRFALNEKCPHHKNLVTEYSRQAWHDDTETDYDNDSETERETGKIPHLWKGQDDSAEMISSFGLPDFQKQA
jgi:hypothetical protein